MNRHLVMLVLALFAGAAQAQGGLSKPLPGAGGDASAEEQAPALPDEDLHRFYVGADYADVTLSVDDDGLSQIPSGKYTSKFVDFRAGYRVLKAVGIEVHGGVPTEKASSDGGRIRQGNYFAAFVVPTATVLSAFELAFPVGYAHSRIKRDFNGTRDSTNLDSVAFGINIEVPVRRYFPSLPDIRIGGGGMVYSQKNNARYYGFHYGLRYEFGI